MVEPTLTVKTMSYAAPVSVVDVDSQGRPVVVVCPFCGDEAKVEASGHITCPTGAAMDRLLADATERLLDAPLSELPPGSVFARSTS